MEEKNKIHDFLYTAGSIQVIHCVERNKNVFIYYIKNHFKYASVFSE